MVQNGSPQIPAAAPGTEPKTETVKVKHRSVPFKKVALAGLALAAWILMFNAGLLVETIDYRRELAPHALGSAIPDSPAATAAARTDSTTSNEIPDNRGTPTPPDAPAGGSKGGWATITAYVVPLFCFTPTNLMLLALAAGLIGGLFSNFAYEALPEDDRIRLQAEVPHRVVYLQEPPISAALRGFVVYLGVIAGVFVVIDDPFGNTTSAQYVRLAGTISIMALVVGYDPTRLQDWLGAAPGPRRSQTPEAPVDRPAPGDQTGAGLPKQPLPAAPAVAAHPLPESEDPMKEKELAADE